MTKQKHFYLIRGLVRESRHWGEFRDLLGASFPDSKITTIDIPGAGEYFTSPSPLSIKTMVEKMRQDFSSHHQEGEESILLAISMGGMISAQWMKTYPDDFEKSILINTSFGDTSPFYQRLKLKALIHLLQVPLLKGRAKEAHILRLVTNHNQVFDKTLDNWEKILQERPIRLANTFRQLFAGALYRLGNWKPQIPVLLLASKEDRMVSVECSRAIAKNWQIPLIEHPTAGHDLTADDPRWVCRELETFLKDQ